MRSTWKRLSLGVMGVCALGFVACGSGDEGGEDTDATPGGSGGAGVDGSGGDAASTGGTSGGAPSGGAATSGGAGGEASGGAAGSGQGGAGGESSIVGCGTVTKATGTPTVIDDFDDDDVADGALPENDGRAGQWAHEHFLNPAGTPIEVERPGGDGPGYLVLSCLAGDDEDHEHCNTEWDAENPWQQWAAVSTLLQNWETPLDCYDVDDVFSGIRFRARSEYEDARIRLQLLTPDSKPDGAETYQSPDITLSLSWETYEVPFHRIEQPSWSSVEAPLDLQALQALSFVVRTMSPIEEGGPVLGEKLEPYWIEIDDIEFYAD